MDKLLIIAPAVANAVFYRMGGSGNYDRWIRPVGMASMTMLAMWILGLWHWSVIPCAGITAGVSTTYFKKSGTNANFFNWFLVGLSFSFAMLPWAILTNNFLGFAIRSLVCTGAIATWSENIGDAVIEESGRGAIQIVTLPLLLIGG